MTNSRAYGAANCYSQVSNEAAVIDADPHHLIKLLLDGALDRIAAAKGYMQRGEVSVHRGTRREPDVVADLAHARRIALVADLGVNELEDLALAGGERCSFTHDLVLLVDEEDSTSACSQQTSVRKLLDNEQAFVV